jgi:Glycosyl hydrolase family 65, N-terminal domain
MTTNRRRFLQGCLAPSLLEALPIGNGRLGGRTFSAARLERIALSESTT